MKIRQVYRIVVFAFVTFLPIFISLWCMTVMPVIVSKNLGYTKVSEKSKIAGYFFTSFFYGLIIGSFFWPSLVKLTTKRNAIFIAVLTQGVFNALQGVFNNIWWLIFCRFICGLAHNLNTVGKGFIFEFSELDYRQYAFSFKSCFGILASFFGPYVGYYIYEYSGESFMWSSIYVSGTYLVALIFFVLVFYLDFTPGEVEDKLKELKENKKEEEKELLSDKEKLGEDQK